MMATSPIFEMFARSPIKPIEQHMAKVNECAQSLKTFIDYILANDWKNAENKQQHISQLEKEADDLKRDLRLHLPKGLFLPVPRTDLLELIVAQDTIANKAKDIAGLMIGRKMTLPKIIQDAFQKYLACALQATQQADTAISELDDLLETGFRGKEAKLVNNMIHQLNLIEHESDEHQIEVRQSLYTIEKDLPPIDVMFLYKIIDGVGELADYAQQVGARLQLLLAR